MKMEHPQAKREAIRKYQGNGALSNEYRQEHDRKQRRIREHAAERIEKEKQLTRKSSKKKPRVINLYAGPGTGKSTTMHAIMAELKYLGFNVEVVPEYAKEATWEMRGTKFFGAQEYIWAKQHFRLYRVASDVEISITDCPLLFCTVYGDECHKRMPSLRKVIHESYENYDNLDIFLKRSNTKAYNPKGRNQNEKEAKVLDRKIRKALDTYVGKDNYIELTFGRENVEQILDILMVKGWIK